MAVKKNPGYMSVTGKLLKIHKIYKPHHTTYQTDIQ